MPDQLSIRGNTPNLLQAHQAMTHGGTQQVHYLGGQVLLQQRYRLLRQLGEGGFSTVYEAEDVRRRARRRRVAIKIISLQGPSVSQIIEATDAFHREVRWLSSLKHAQIPTFFTHFSDAAHWYLVMDMIKGESLEQYTERYRSSSGKTGLPVEEVVAIGLLLCRVLAYLHAIQPPVIFRDLKPGNIMCKPDGMLVLIDFGIARRFRTGQNKDTIPFGSPGYAAPEQYGKAQTTPKADIYSLGALLHHLLTGSDPSLTLFQFAPLLFQYDPILAPLETLIQQMVELDVEKRPESVQQVRQVLLRCFVKLQGRSARARKVSFRLLKNSLKAPVSSVASSATSYQTGSAATVRQVQRLVRRNRISSLSGFVCSFLGLVLLVSDVGSILMGVQDLGLPCFAFLGAGLLAGIGIAYSRKSRHTTQVGSFSLPMRNMIILGEYMGYIVLILCCIMLLLLFLRMASIGD